MQKIFCSNLINRTVCSLLVAVFLSTYPTGMTALAFCLDETENHVIGPNLYLADCHSSLQVGQIISDEHYSALVERENNKCTDVSLTNANTLNRPSKKNQPVSCKGIFSYVFPRSQQRFYQQKAGLDSKLFSQYMLTLPRISALRTIVLLI